MSEQKAAEGAAEGVASTSQAPTSKTATGAFSYLQPYARSKGPVTALTSLFAISSFVPPAALPLNVFLPHYLQRVAFSLGFGVATYAFVCGDVRNGSGIATSWSLGYLFFNFRKSLRAPRHPLPLALTGGAAACAALYGTEYFLYQS